MKTVEDFFNSSHSHPFHTERFNKIQQLRKPVYSKKIKQRKPRLSLQKTDFITTLYSQNFNRINNPNEQKKITKSKSQLSFKKNKLFQESSHSKDHLTSNLIIQKLQCKKDNEKSSIKKNNFIKLFQRITAHISSNQSLIKVPLTQQKSDNENKINKKSISLKRSSQNNSPLINKNMKFKQNMKIVDIAKKQDIQSNLIIQLAELRKKRNSLGQVLQEKGQNHQMLPRNSLFFMNYLKRKQKRQSTQKQPHINFVKNATQVIKIQENPDLRKTLITKQNQKNLFRNKISLEKLQKIGRIFNSMKIEPW